MSRPGPPRALAAVAPLALLVAVGCGAGDPAGDEAIAFDVDVAMAESIHTVYRVRWTLEPADLVEAYVEFGTEEPLTQRAPATDDGEGHFEAVLLGLKPNTRYLARGVVVDGDEVLHGDVEQLVTGSAPPWLPRFHPVAGVHDPEHASDGFVLTGFVPGPAVIVDADGELVWWHDPDSDPMLSVTRMVLAPDRRSVLYLAWDRLTHGGPSSDLRVLVQAPLDGGPHETFEVPTAHHDFALLPDGTVALLTYDAREVDGEQVVGDAIVERSPDGALRTVWSVWDHHEYDPDAPHDEGEEWGHCNALDHDADAGLYYLSCRNFDAIFAIDADDGEELWRLGDGGDFALDGADDRWFSNEHQIDRVDGGMLVFDNGDPTAQESRVVEYALDTDAMEARQVWAVGPQPPMHVMAFGDVQRLPSGNVLINYGAAGRIEEVTADGRAVSRLDLELGAGVGYGSWTGSLYPE